MFVQALVLLVIQAHYPKLKPPPCNVFDPTSHCEKIGGISAVLLYVALYLLAAGSAGIKAVLPSHGADQFDEKDPKEKKQMSSFLQLPSISSMYWWCYQLNTKCVDPRS